MSNAVAVKPQFIKPVLLSLLVGAFALSACSKQDAAPPKMGPMPVTVLEMQPRSVPNAVEIVAQTEGAREVDGVKDQPQLVAKADPLANVFQIVHSHALQTGQLVGQFALFSDGFEDRLTTVFQFAQIAQPGLQFAQLNIIESVGHFFAVARNKRYRGATVQQFDCGFYLLFGDLDLCGNLPNDFLHEN